MPNSLARAAIFPPASPIFYSPPSKSFTPARKRGKLVSTNCGNPNSLLRNALMSASMRHRENLRTDPLFIDPYVGCFLSLAIKHDDTMEEQLLTSAIASSLSQYRLTTKFIDDKLLSFLSSNEELRQVVLLTDGMDTRPYRLRWPRSCVMFDVSPDGIFRIALEKLEGIGAKVSKTCILLHVPLESDDLQTSLCNRGFNGNKPSLWALQGLPLISLASLKDALFTISSLATKGSIFMGELPSCLLQDEFPTMSTTRGEMEKLFMAHGFEVGVVECDEVARNLRLPTGDGASLLFVAKQLRFSDAQMESWRGHFERLEDEGDEEGFEEL